MASHVLALAFVAAYVLVTGQRPAPAAPDRESGTFEGLWEEFQDPAPPRGAASIAA